MSNQGLNPYVTISLTDACNLRCIYCPPAGENYQTPRTTFAPDQVSQVLQVVANLGLSKVRFTGGEPLLYPHLRRVCEEAASVGLEVHFNTNGLLLIKHLPWLRQIPRLFIKVSLDAHTNAAMRRIAGVGQIKPVLEGLRQGAARGVIQRLNFVLTQLNFSQLPGVLAICKELKIGLKVFDMFPVPETEAMWRRLYSPPDALSLEGETAPPYEYTLKYGTPTQELIVDGVHVRVKNCFNGTRYHAICRNCPAFPCPEGLYCLTVTPSLTVVPCRLGTHLHRQGYNQAALTEAIQEAITIYQESYFANLFGRKYIDFYQSRLASPAAVANQAVSRPMGDNASAICGGRRALPVPPTPPVRAC